MKKLKQLFCKHEYKFYTDTEIFHTIFSISPVIGYKYICPKCNKEITLDSIDILHEINKLKEDIRKKNILGKDTSYLNEDSKFEMKTLDFSSYPMLYRGKHIDVLKKKYKNEGINLNEITQWYENNLQTKGSVKWIL